jgi:Zn-dependent alcohol dehydrogenase
MNKDVQTARALVTHRPRHGQCNWKVERVIVGPIQDDELLVRIVAAGICHTDVAFSLREDFLGIFPRVLGHEGSCRCFSKTLP